MEMHDLERVAQDALRQPEKTSSRAAIKLLAEAGFTDFPDVRPGARVCHRVIGDCYDTVTQFPDGHMEGMRQPVPEDRLKAPLLLPNGDDIPEGVPILWQASGDPLEVVRELLAQPTTL